MSVASASLELIHLSYMELELAFGKVLKALREKADISQEKLAEFADMHPTTISMYERGIRKPTLYTVFILSRALNLQPDIMVSEVMKLKPELE